MCTLLFLGAVAVAAFIILWRGGPRIDCPYPGPHPGHQLNEGPESDVCPGKEVRSDDS
jgi:hypothetical protein